MADDNSEPLLIIVGLGLIAVLFFYILWVIWVNFPK